VLGLRLAFAMLGGGVSGVATANGRSSPPVEMRTKDGERCPTDPRVADGSARHESIGMRIARFS
jgi:hypothetical protein